MEERWRSEWRGWISEWRGGGEVSGGRWRSEWRGGGEVSGGVVEK